MKPKSSLAAIPIAVILAIPVGAQTGDPTPPPAPASPDPSTLYSFRLGYAPNGAIVSSQDSVNGNWTYSYDALDRLLGATRPGRALSYDYDRNGNRWRQNSLDLQAPSRQYGFDTSSNHIVGMTYDALGNIISDALHTYTYDAENRLINVDGGATAQYAYDALGRRVRKFTTGGATEYLYDPDGHVVATRDTAAGTWRSSEVYAGDRHLATYANGTTYFHHRDWLGSNRLTTLPDWTSTEQCTDLPFGDGLACSQTGAPPASTPFAQYERDAESQLDHTWFRQYSSAQGRWTTPDPYLGSIDPSDPQSLNRYAYVTNDPVRFRDPTGLYMGCVLPDDTVSEAEEDGGLSEGKCADLHGQWMEIDTVIDSVPTLPSVPVNWTWLWWDIALPTPVYGGMAPPYRQPTAPQSPMRLPCAQQFRIPDILQQAALTPPAPCTPQVPCMSEAPHAPPPVMRAKEEPPRRSNFEIFARTLNCAISFGVPVQQGTWEACEREARSGGIGHVEESPHEEVYLPRRLAERWEPCPWPPEASEVP
jgi:RHS repeat-associated protein